jgi:hypothetical protein
MAQADADAGISNQRVDVYADGPTAIARLVSFLAVILWHVAVCLLKFEF